MQRTAGFTATQVSQAPPPWQDLCKITWDEYRASHWNNGGHIVALTSWTGRGECSWCYPLGRTPDVERSPTTPVQTSGPTRNVVLFGETGVGKSSIINLIADELLAPTSNDALGCTATHKHYDVTLPPSPPQNNTLNVTLWDTAGLDEGTWGTVPAGASAAQLRSLLHTLARSPSGVHLLLFCIRGTGRLTGSLARQYELVYADMCRRRVPIVLVVTGLESLYLDGPTMEMENWWTAHAEEVERLGMAFDAHACVTTVEVELEGTVAEDTGRARRLASQSRMRQLVAEFARPGTAPWTIGPSWRLVVVSVLCRILRAARGTRGGDEERVDSLGLYRRYLVLGRRWLVNMVRIISGTKHRDTTHDTLSSVS